MIVNLTKWVSTPTEKGHHVLVAKFSLENGKVICSDPSLLAYMYEAPMYNVEEQKWDKMVTPDDGELFMKNLKHHFRDPAMLAMEVE